ncbi:MAG: RNA-directed DNA polymerase [Bacilli bacterium]|nr:RNA-directed DNA polymerase [Bacilli bacterium]
MWKYTGIKECNDFLLSLNLFDCKDEKKYIKTIYSISNNIESNYRIYKIKKNNGKYRTIYEPNPLLKKIQKKILINILNNKSISKYAKAYHKGISLKENAILHVNKKVLLKLDIRNFFENISFLDIYNSCFSIEYFPKSVGMLLTYLCTYNEHLTQGSPTSAYISNLVMKDFDEEIGSWCDLNKITYTRYSDDMTFSGDFNPSKIITKVRSLLYKLFTSLRGGS